MREALIELKEKLNSEQYIADDALVTTLYVAAKLNRPLLIEGAAGAGKTETISTFELTLQEGGAE